MHDVITVWLQIFVVENFRKFRNYAVITKILFTKFSSQLIIHLNCYGITNLFLQKFTFTENQPFYEIFILRKFGAIRYVCVSSQYYLRSIIVSVQLDQTLLQANTMLHSFLELLQLLLIFQYQLVTMVKRLNSLV